MVEGDQEHYAFQTPFLLIPDLSDSDITNPLTEENYRALMPISLGLTVGDTGDATVTEPAHHLRRSLQQAGRIRPRHL